MLKEYDRIKFEYDASLTKIELRMKEALEKKNKEVRYLKYYINTFEIYFFIF